MDYSIAKFILRTEGPHSDIATCGLQCFKPFEVEHDASVEPTMLLKMDSQADKLKHPAAKVIHSFDFEQNYATGELLRYATGYIFKMVREDKVFVLAKEDGSNIVESNLGHYAEADPSLVRFGIWIMFGIIIAPLGAIAIHSSVAVKDNEGVLCLGESGTGKSTHTRLWRENIEGAVLLNDDSPILRIIDGKPWMYGSPWSGKTPCYKQESYPLAACVRLSQAPYNKIQRLSIPQAYAALHPSCPPDFAYDDTLYDCISETIGEVLAQIPLYHLACLPNAEAAQLSCKTVFGE